jgi:hypothetical protein
MNVYMFKLRCVRVTTVAMENQKQCVRCTVALHIAHEMANCRNAHNSSNRHPRITRQLSNKHTLRQNFESRGERMLLLILL